MKRKDKKIMLLSISPDIKEMLRYQSYKSGKSQNNLIEEILKSCLEKELSGDTDFKELAKI